jgi:hypothetical protein
MKMFTALTLALTLCFQSVAFGEVNGERLARLAQQREATLNAEIEAKKTEIEQLKNELKQEKGRGAQWYFHKIAIVCGVTGAAGVIMAALPMDRSTSVDVAMGRPIVGAGLAVLGGLCGSISYGIMELVNGDVELADKLVDVAEFELKKLEREQSRK